MQATEEDGVLKTALRLRSGRMLRELESEERPLMTFEQLLYCGELAKPEWNVSYIWLVWRYSLNSDPMF